MQCNSIDKVARLVLVLVVLLIWFAPAKAIADLSNLNALQGKVMLGVGTLGLNSSLSGFRKQQEWLSIDGEGDLGLGNHAIVPWLALEYRLNDHWSLYGEYLDTSRIGSVMRYSTVKLFGVLPLTIGTRYETTLRLTNYRVGLDYTVVDRADVQVGARFGLDVLDARLRMRTTTLPMEEMPAQNGVAPLPTVGLWGRYQLTDKGTVRIQLDGFPLHGKNFVATTANAFVGYEYQSPWGVDFGLGYMAHRFSLFLQREARSRDATYSYGGVMLYMGMGF